MSQLRLLQMVSSRMVASCALSLPAASRQPVKFHSLLAQQHAPRGCTERVWHNAAAVALFRQRMCVCAAAGSAQVTPATQRPAHLNKTQQAAGRPSLQQFTRPTRPEHLQPKLQTASKPSEPMSKPIAEVAEAGASSSADEPQLGCLVDGNRQGLASSSSSTGSIHQSLHASFSHAASAGSVDGATETQGLTVGLASRPSKPRPRRSSSHSSPNKDDGVPTAKKSGKAGATTRQQPQTEPVITTELSAADGLPQHSPQQLKAAAAAASQQVRQSAAAGPAGSSYSEPDMALRSAISSNSRQTAVLVPPTAPVTAEAQAWAAGLGIDNTTLDAWQAGMAWVQHPLRNSGRMVEVLALPYYRQGKLVDVRYMHLADGCLVGSWLARGASQLYMREQDVQVAEKVVFVNCELDALMLSAAGVAAIAVPRQSPAFSTPVAQYQHIQQQGPVLRQQQHLQASLDPQDMQEHSQQQTSTSQQHMQPHQQRYMQPQWHSLLQLVQLQQQQQQQHQQRWQPQQRVRLRPEDPRLRLSGLQAEQATLQRQHELCAASGKLASSGRDSGEGLIVGNLGQAPLTGLKLLCPAAQYAVLALHEGPEGEAVAQELATLLGEVDCRRVNWPEITPSAAAAALAAKGFLPEANGRQFPASGNAVSQHIDCAAGSDDVLDGSSVDPVKTLLEHSVPAGVALQLQQLLQGPPASGWSLLLVQALLGQHQMQTCVDTAYVWPIAGLERFSDHYDDLVSYWSTPDIGTLALSTGWPSLDDYYKVTPGEVTLVTGVPNSGKSEWLDALAVNLAHQHGWRFAVCSMEKRPRDHARQLLEKIAGKPMLQAKYAEDVEHMSEEELIAAYRFLCEHFVVIASGENSMPSLHWVLEKARAAKIQHGINGLLVDPYNELDPTRSGNLREHEHVSEFMGLLRKFARENKVHVWLVAHPRQMASNWQGQRPGLQDISGGANFANKADNGIIVHRDWSKLKELQQRAGGQDSKGTQGLRSSTEQSPADAGTAANSGNGSDSGTPARNQEYQVQIFVEKVRNKITGCRGQWTLMYDRTTGRYHEVGQQPNRQFIGAEADVVNADLSDNVEVLDDPAALEAYDQQLAAQWPAGVSQGYGSISQYHQKNDEEVLAQRREAMLDAW